MPVGLGSATAQHANYIGNGINGTVSGTPTLANHVPLGPMINGDQREFVTPAAVSRQRLVGWTPLLGPGIWAWRKAQQIEDKALRSRRDFLKKIMF